MIVAQAVVTIGPASARPGPSPRSFDLQAHCGGIGLTTESTLAAFDKALRLGVSTLELDTQVTRDLCRDTAPATIGDQQFPYVGKYIKDLTLAQITTLDCGYRRLTDFPDQEQISGARIIELRELFALIRSRKARHVMMNIETKVEAGAQEQTMPREVFVRRVYEEVARSGLRRQVTIQSFDWVALAAMHRLEPRIPLVALTNRDFLQVGQPGKSPWLGGIDADDFGGDLVRSALTVPGLRAISPVQGFPQNGRYGSPDFTPYPDTQMITDVHRAGLKVIPWTVDDPATMAYFIDLGVDGLITDYPDRLREVLRSKDIPLPRPVRE